MDIDLDRRQARLSVGEFSDFSLGPRESGGSGGGLWRAQLGSRWHRELRRREEEAGGTAVFEVPLDGAVFRRGWTLRLSGRIDQARQIGETTLLLRELKTVAEALPRDEGELRDLYPSYFVQAAAYVALLRENPALSPLPLAGGLHGELVFVEADTGLAQVVGLGQEGAGLFEEQAARLVDFLEARLRARERLRGLVFRPPFEQLREGQQDAEGDLRSAFEAGRTAVLLEAPTGFGKTGVLLAFGLGALRQGRFERLLYLTGKSTGQLQVVSTLGSMTQAGAVAVWHVRNKAEHCVNAVFHCVRESCSYLNGGEKRWAASGLARLYLFGHEPRDIASLRAAGQAARICPYEITRAALPFNDVWIGDYNYIFSPDSRALFHERPGFERSRTLLIVDEAHNLPARVADAWSHAFGAAEAAEVAAALARVHAPARLTNVWQEWAHFLGQLPRCDGLRLADEEDARELLGRLCAEAAGSPVDAASLGAALCAALWKPGSVFAQLEESPLPRLWWCPRPGDLLLTCLDACAVLGEELRAFGGVVLATATPGPEGFLGEACGLDAAQIPVPAAAPPPIPVAPPGQASPRAGGAGPAPRVVAGRLGALPKRTTRQVFAKLTSGAALLQAEQTRQASSLHRVRAWTPWRDGAYAVAVDTRVDTTFQHRERHLDLTADTMAALVGPGRAAPPAGECRAALAAFFPSFAYAEAALRALAGRHPCVAAGLQPRKSDLAAQTAWVEASLQERDVLLLVLGSGFAEGIDVLGGRIHSALVAGPALPEVNAVQAARMASRAGLGRDGAFDRTYRIPGMQKVNQALGRLVRAPGQRARVLLHCRRFAEPGYGRLLDPDYAAGRLLRTDADLAAWIAEGAQPAPGAATA